MAITTASQIFKEFESGIWKPFYLILGDEPFQTSEILHRIRRFFIKNEESAPFNFESWEGEGLDTGALLTSLDMYPGLFSTESAVRLILCQRFDKTTPTTIDILDRYFTNPSPTTCFVMQASKVDKRKGWYKRVLESGNVVEVSEPYEREWPKWQGYFERKIGKQFESSAWDRLVEGANRTLALVWSEAEKAALYVGDKSTISECDVMLLASGSLASDIFQFAEDVVCNEPFLAMKAFHSLLREGENEIKILSILIRQFRMVDQCLCLMKGGIVDPKMSAKEIGAHPFFVSKIIQQTKRHTSETLGRSLDLLSECDFRMKRGEGGLFEGFLISYFGMESAKC